MSQFETRIVRYVQFMLTHPNSSYLRDYVTIELDKSGFDLSQVPPGYLFYRTYSRQEAHAPDGEVLIGKIRDESDWKSRIEDILNK